MPVSSPEPQKRVDSHESLPPTVAPWTKAGHVLGYVWTTLFNIPFFLYSLILRVGSAVAGVFSRSSEASSEGKQISKAKVDTSESTAAHVFKKTAGKKESEDEEDLGLAFLFGDREGAESEKAEIPTGKEVIEDPLTSMGAMDIEHTRRLSEAAVIDPLASKELQEKVQEEALSLVKGVVQPVKEILAQLDSSKLTTLKDILVAHRQLEKESEDLRSLQQQYEGLPAAQAECNETLQAVEEKMTELGKQAQTIAQGLVQSAKKSLKQWDGKRPSSLEGLQFVTRDLEEKYKNLAKLLYEYAGLPTGADVKESQKHAEMYPVEKLLLKYAGLPGAQEEFHQTFQAIQEKMTELGPDVMQQLLPSEKIIQEVEATIPAELQDYHRLTERLEEANVPLRVFVSRFEYIVPSIHERIQGMNKAIYDKKTALDAEMCAQIRMNYRPNPRIPGEGNCQFHSIRDLLGNKEKQQHYRKLAVDYIRQHLDDDFVAGFQTYKEAIRTEMRSKHAQQSMTMYMKKLGGKALQNKSRSALLQAWYEQLEKKLGRVPEEHDFYLDCMENHNLWGDTLTVLALSEQLKMPILILTRVDSRTWRFDSCAGRTKFGDKPPLLLYYNGVNHYQDLIPK